MRNSKGFGAVEALLIVVIFGLIGFVGWYVWNSKQNTDKNLNSAANTNITGAATKKKSQTVDLYAGWKSACDTFTKHCFKYPSDWKATSSTYQNPTGMDFTVFNKTNQLNSTVLVTYTGNDERDGGTDGFTTLSINSVNDKSLHLKIVGGYDSHNEPGYIMMAESQVTSEKLAVGKVTQSQAFTSRFTNGVSGDSAFFALPFPADKFTSIEGATSWFSSDDSKIILLILQSFYKQ